MSGDLSGRRVLVTGASSGIGAEVCRSIVAGGGSVAMVARREERLDELHDELGQRAVPIPCDVTDTAALEAAVDDSAAQLGGLDGLVAVAGRSMVGTLASGTPERWRGDLRPQPPRAARQHPLRRRKVRQRRAAGCRAHRLMRGIAVDARNGDLLRVEAGPRKPRSKRCGSSSPRWASTPAS